LLECELFNGVRLEQGPAEKFSFPFTCPPKPRRRRGRKNQVPGAKSKNVKKTFLRGGDPPTGGEQWRDGANQSGFSTK